MPTGLHLKKRIFQRLLGRDLHYATLAGMKFKVGQDHRIVDHGKINGIDQSDQPFLQVDMFRQLVQRCIK